MNSFHMVCATSIFKAVKDQGAQSMTYIHNFYKPQILKSALYVCAFENFFSTSSYVKDKINIYSHATLMIKILGMYLHLRAPKVFICMQIFNNSKVIDQCEKCNRSMNESWIRSLLTQLPNGGSMQLKYTNARMLSGLKENL